ncbi:hypothetical protein SAMN05444337_1360 [Flavobacterium haoranii]|uniref:Uncharacterized protein n=1 Tax=Flavobacterium haoranii TaxID=683124 RepID=A0A1M6FYI8_9FLAO|nr:hypothetical protein SAMN05444337_1360 [Flavobacterium haoranii]
MTNSLCLNCSNSKTCSLTTDKDKVWDCSEYKTQTTA